MPDCNQFDTCEDKDKVGQHGCHCNPCFDHMHQNCTDKPSPDNLIHVDDWEEEYGDCLFFSFPTFKEPPEVYCGSPWESDFDRSKWKQFVRLDFNGIIAQAEDDLQP